MLARSYRSRKYSGFVSPGLQDVRIARITCRLLILTFLFAINFSTAVSAAKIEGRVLANSNQQQIRGLMVTATDLVGRRGFGAIAFTSGTGNFALDDLPLVS
jgi:hypothetical protein